MQLNESLTLSSQAVLDCCMVVMLYKRYRLHVVWYGLIVYVWATEMLLLHIIMDQRHLFSLADSVAYSGIRKGGGGGSKI